MNKYTMDKAMIDLTLLQRDNKQKNKTSNKFKAAALGNEAACFCFEF